MREKFDREWFKNQISFTVYIKRLTTYWYIGIYLKNCFYRWLDLTFVVYKVMCMVRWRIVPPKAAYHWFLEKYHIVWASYALCSTKKFKNLCILQTTQVHKMKRKRQSFTLHSICTVWNHKPSFRTYDMWLIKKKGKWREKKIKWNAMQCNLVFDQIVQSQIITRRAASIPLHASRTGSSQW